MMTTYSLHFLQSSASLKLGLYGHGSHHHHTRLPRAGKNRPRKERLLLFKWFYNKHRGHIVGYKPVVWRFGWPAAENYSYIVRTESDISLQPSLSQAPWPSAWGK